MFNNLGLALGTNLKFYTSVKKELKLKVGEFWGANSYVCRSYREKTGRGPFWPPPPHLSSWIGLKKLNKLTYKKDKKKLNIFNENTEEVFEEEKLIPIKTPFVEKKDDRSTLCSFDGLFQVLHRDIGNVEFLGISAADPS